MHIDIELLNRHRAREAALFIESGCFTNWLGVRTDASVFGNGDRFRDRILADIPSTEAGDDVFAGYLEYAALLTAIESVPDRKRFTAVELGAGWGPWISACGVVCRDLEFEQTVLLGVEADQGRHEFMRRHLARNELLDVPNIDCKTIHGAIWTEDTVLKFPACDLSDSGGAVSVDASGHDYRGYDTSFVEVPAFALTTLCQTLPTIDYMHCDIQGSELRVLSSAIEFLDAHVRYLFVGTHSRFIDGGLISLFYEHGWDILAELPCYFEYDRRIPSLEGMTKRDGEIFVRNPRLLAG
jgi:FkbM family methyltransferase